MLSCFLVQIYISKTLPAKNKKDSRESASVPSVLSVKGLTFSFDSADKWID